MSSHDNEYSPSHLSTKTKHSKGKMAHARTAVKLLVFVGVLVGLCIHTGFGTYSSAGIGFVASVCPLGALEGLFGAKAFIPRLIIGLLIMLALIFFFGRAFCSWICPIPPLSSFFKTRKRKAEESKTCDEAGRFALERWKKKTNSVAEVSMTKEEVGAAVETSIPEKETSARFDSRHFVLCGALGSAAIFGFPVFCLICPVGLTCATLVLLMRLLGIGELSWGLFVFPVVLILELTLLKNYCSKICPIAALMSLVARISPTFKPQVNKETCLRDTEGAACHMCSSVCPEHIDPCSNLGVKAINECSRCGRCVDTCPEHALSIPFLPKK